MRRAWDILLQFTVAVAFLLVLVDHIWDIETITDFDRIEMMLLAFYFIWDTDKRSGKERR